MHVDNTIGRGPRLRNPSRRRPERRPVLLEERNHLGVVAGGGRLLESLAGNEGLVRHAGFLRRLRALVQLAHEALVGPQRGLCERRADVGDGGLHQGEVMMSTGLRSEVGIAIAMVCREVEDCFAGV